MLENRRPRTPKAIFWRRIIQHIVFIRWCAMLISPSVEGCSTIMYNEIPCLTPSKPCTSIERRWRHPYASEKGIICRTLLSLHWHHILQQPCPNLPSSKLSCSDYHLVHLHHNQVFEYLEVRLVLAALLLPVLRLVDLALGILQPLPNYPSDCSHWKNLTTVSLNIGKHLLRYLRWIFALPMQAVAQVWCQSEVVGVVRLSWDSNSLQHQGSIYH